MHITENQARRLKKLADKLAEWVITVAGVTVIAAMFAMLALIVREAAPLFFPATQRMVGAVSLPDGVAARDVAALGVEGDLSEKMRVAGVILRDGRCGFARLDDGEPKGFALERLPEAPASAAILSVEVHDNDKFSVLWDDGTASLYAMEVRFPAGADGKPAAAHSFYPVFHHRPDQAEWTNSPPLSALLRGDAAEHRVVGVFADGSVAERRLAPGAGLLGRSKSVASQRTIRIGRGGAVTAAALSDDGMLYMGTNEGNLLSLDLSGDAEGEAASEVTPVFRDRRAISALVFLNGGYAVAVGDASGAVSVWFPRRENGEFRLRRSVDWPTGGGGVKAMAVSGRDRGLVALDDAGRLRWFYSTTGNELLEIPASRSRPELPALNARADNLATLHADGAIVFSRLDSSYPEAGWAGFFKRLLYEGYETAAYVWQSTGSDASEPKLSLMPLVWGSVKAAVFALLFATPIALAAAMYLSQFAAPAFRARLKPAVEMLAAVPSVVIGFIAALWLAPLMERYLRFFAGASQYDQRNSLVIAIAMGFAVIPTVFSLAEDAISAVPPALSAASLALGASKWQTVIRVVVPTASPGIFTAVMLGFGRAVGETMIVLMAAGNTPIISLSPFNGMRTLSANIAVEMPEAPVGGTLYRTLFLCALILFVLTLAINTAAEVFRHRLRNRYGKV
ncbi:MAG: phosphate ABC transporter permease subunit PstC [Planctomycetota bacterium]|jgi:phosphate transport system permease protein|nr:phosphate ABC transporter permease subunit PstC [Planctomycetota bacterium]